jgi:hypothetical protein
MARRICYGCPPYLPPLYGAPVCGPSNRAYADRGAQGTPGSIPDGAHLQAQVAEVCRLGARNIKTWAGHHSPCASIGNSPIDARVTRLHPARLPE